MSNYDDYKLFIWNENNILYSNDTNLYNDVYLHTGNIMKGCWENCVCFTYIDNEEKIIGNSNHFINGHKWDKGYNNLYKIYDNIVKNYQEFKEHTIHKNYDFNSNKTYFYMLGAFSFSNSGHDLSTMFDFVNYIIQNNIKDILIYKNYKNTNNFKLLNLLIPDDCQFIELNENQIYKIKNIIIIPPKIICINYHKYLIDKLKNIIQEKYALKFSHLHNKNIVLIKSNRNKNVMLKFTQLICEEMLLYLEKNDFVVLIPEEMDIFELCIYLLFANKIVLSEGSVLYTNKIFINNHAKLIFFPDHHGKMPFCSGEITNSNITLLDTKTNIFTYDECIDLAKKIINF